VKYNPRIHHKSSTRLRGYDYSQPGAYFITANCYGRNPLFGNILNGQMFLNEYGKIAQHEWLRTPIVRPNVSLGPYIVMPDHIHGIIIIDYPISGKINLLETPEIAPFISPSQTVGAIMRGYMGTVTSQINNIRNTPNEIVWQPRFHDHIIRSEKAIQRITRYIENNPLNWKG
jgi:REP element-mobilizing transposase RayT